MWNASWQGLLQNFAILVILVSVWTHGMDWVEGRRRWHREALGVIVAGGGVILLMLAPFEIRPGITIDLRYALIGLAGFLGSPLIGIVAGIVAATFRIVHTGGVGATAGALSIAISTATGVAGGLLLRGRPATVRDLLIFAGVATIIPLTGSLALLPAVPLRILVDGAPSLVGMTLLAILLAGLAVIEADHRRETARANVFYRAIIDTLPEPLNAKDLEGRFLAANPATAHQVNASSVAALIGKTDFDFHGEAVARGLRADEERVLAAGHPETIEQVLVRPDGARVWLSTLKAPLRNHAGLIVGLLTHNRDMTERKRLEDQIAQGRQRLDEALEHMADGLAMFDRKARLILCNAQYRTMFPLTAEMRFPGARLEDILRASVERGEQIDIAPGAVDAWIRYTLDHFTAAGETDIQMGDGRWLRARVRPTADGGSLTLMTDVTQTKRAESVLNDLNQRLMNLASEDGLTGLSNRRAFDVALPRAVAQSRRDGKPLSLLLIDVDHFKAYNDTFGHPAGDTCLRTIGNLLRMSLKRPSDVAARYGGEEFAAILPDTPEEGGMQLAETLRTTVLGLGMQHPGTRAGVLTISIGVATMEADGDGARPEALTAEADAALYAAKAAGRNRTVAADRAMRLAAAG